LVVPLLAPEPKVMACTSQWATNSVFLSTMHCRNDVKMFLVVYCIKKVKFMAKKTVGPTPTNAIISVTCCDVVEDFV
jgi:hypothetical protein